MPYVTEECFDAEFNDLLVKKNVSLVYTPHPGIWWKLKQLSDIDGRFKVCNEWPHEEDLRPYSLAYEWANLC
ncbi:hypothetical protein D3C77_614630 [compost metagenome]